ncbi:enoyl-CoA hydratase/isomerase family protein [Rhodococcus koreensis]
MSQASATTAVQASTEGVVGYITLSEPERRNPLSVAAMRPFRQALTDLSGNPAVRVIVVRALGPAFSAGHDLTEVVALDHRAHTRHRDSHRRKQLPRACRGGDHTHHCPAAGGSDCAVGVGPAGTGTQVGRSPTPETYSLPHNDTQHGHINRSMVGLIYRNDYFGAPVRIRFRFQRTMHSLMACRRTWRIPIVIVVRWFSSLIGRGGLVTW